MQKVRWFDELNQKLDKFIQKLLDEQNQKVHADFNCGDTVGRAKSTMLMIKLLLSFLYALL